MEILMNCLMRLRVKNKVKAVSDLNSDLIYDRFARGVCDSGSCRLMVSSELGLLCNSYFYTVLTKTDCEIAMNIEDQINKLSIMEESLRGRSFRKNLNITE